MNKLEQVQALLAHLEDKARQYGLPVDGPCYRVALWVERVELKKALGLRQSADLDNEQLRFEYELQERENA